MRHIACIFTVAILILTLACSGGDPAAAVDIRESPGETADGEDTPRVVIDPDDFELRYTFACEPLNCVTECSIQEGDWFECESPFLLTQDSEIHDVQEGRLRFGVRSLHEEEMSSPAEVDLLILHQFDFEIEETHGLDSGNGERSYYYEDEFAATCSRDDCELRCYWDHESCADCPIDAECTIDEPFSAELPEGLTTAELVVEACAQDFNGEPGDEHCTDPKVYTFYPAPPGWTSISAGDEHTCAILDDETLWCWGLNNAGQLGLNNTNSPVATATRVPSVRPNQRWTQVSSGERHTCAIETTGDLYCWGLQSDGRLGDDSASNTTQPVLVHQNEGPWINVAAGARHTCAVEEGGQLFCWGYNGQGQLGDGSNTASTDPVSVGIQSGTNRWVAVTAGTEHTCALANQTASNELRAYCWGRADDGRLGNESDVDSFDTPQEVKGTPASSDTHTISAGDTHTCATLTSATGLRTYCWGSGAEGRLGINAPGTISIPDRVDGEDEFTKVVVGTDHSCGLHVDDVAYCWGEDVRDQLGTGEGQTYEPNPIIMPEGVGVNDIEAGSEHSCAIGTNGRIYCWGRTTQGRLGIAGVNSSNPLPTMISWPQGELVPE